MDVDVVLGELLVVDVEIFRFGSDVRICGGDRLAHDIAELTRDSGASAAGHSGRFDEHDLAAELRPRQSGRDADLGMALRELVFERWQTEVRLDLGSLHGVERLLRSAGNFAGNLPENVAELALQVAHACLGGVVANHHQQRVVADGHVRGGETVVFEQLGDQMLLRDLQLLAFRVAGKPDHFHPIAQRTRNRVEHVCRADEERVREIERNLEIAVDERDVLLRVHHFEKRRGRIAAIVLPDLVDLVDHDQRVVHADLDVALDHAARHRADVGLAMPADLRLVGDAADGHAHELAAERLGDRRAEGGLADARRSG